MKRSDTRDSAPKPLPPVTFEPMTADAAGTLGPLLSRIDPWQRYCFTPDALTAFLASTEADAVRFTINSDRTLAGAVAVKRDWLRGPYLQFLAVLPAYQRQGIGGRVLDWFEGEAARRGAQNLWIAASDFNVQALALYESRGFVRAALLPDLIAEGTAEILLRKRLTPR